jgi:superfamily I DNA/RNA helicase
MQCKAFTADYPGIASYNLRVNYRCSNAIASVANSIIGKLATQSIKAMSAPSKDVTASVEDVTSKEEPVRIALVPDEYAEAGFVSKVLKTLIDKKAANSQRSCAIMYRTNSQSRIFEVRNQ